MSSNKTIILIYFLEMMLMLVFTIFRKR